MIAAGRNAGGAEYQGHAEPEDAPTRLLRSEFAAQWTILVLALLAVGAVLGYVLLQQRRSLEKNEADRLRTQVHLLEQNMVRQLDSVNAALEGISASLEGAKSDETSRSLNFHLKVLESAMPGVRTFVTADFQGRVRFSNRDELIGIDVSGREYFRTARTGRDRSRLYVSPPFKTVLGAYVLNLTRVVSGPAGEFRGVVTASLDPEFFNVLLSSSLYAPDMWTSIVHADGLQFLMVPSRKGRPKLNLGKPGSFFSRHAESGRPEALLTGTSYATGEERMMALHTVRPSQVDADKHLVVSVTRDLGVIYSGWKHDLRVQTTLYGVVVLFSIAGLLRYQKWKRATAEEISRDEQIIRGLNDELNRFFDLSANLLSITDMEGNFTRVNRAWAEVLGYSAEDLNGVRYLDLVHEVDRTATVQAARNLTIGKPMHGLVNRCRHRDGTYRWIEWHAMPYENHTIFGVAQDVTQRRLLEDEREELIGSLRTALESVKTLSGLIPICAWCKKIRDDGGYWQQIEHYLAENSDAMLTHGICPACAANLQKEESESRTSSPLAQQTAR